MRPALAALVLLAACGSAPPAIVMPEAKPAIVTQIGHLDPSSTVPVVSDDMMYPVEGHDVPATIVHPTTGTWPAIVVMASSTPADRNWNNPLLPGHNGSGKQLAEALAAHGAVVLRFDKAGVGGNKLPPPQITMDTYVDEERGALAFLRRRPDVDAQHMYIVGHGEGSIHAIRAAIAEGGRIAGLALLSPAGRTQRDVTLAQLDAQLKAEVAAGKLGADAAKAQMDIIAQALNDFVEGRDVDPAKAAGVKAIQDPRTAKLARDMLAFDPADAVVKLRVPVFLFAGLKDIETDPRVDASHLQDALKTAGQDVTLFLAPDANYVLKHETKSTAALRADLASVQAGYSAADVALDTTTVAALANWIAAHDKP